MVFFRDKLQRAAFNHRATALRNAVRESVNVAGLRGNALREHQTGKLKQLLAYAWTEIPFYRRTYEAAGFRPEMFSEWADLAKIPVITKEALRAADRKDLYPASGDIPAYYVTTSGSTGVPVGLYKSHESILRFTAAAMLRFYEWCHGRPLENALYILDSNPRSIDYVLADALRSIALEERFISAFRRIRDIRDAVDGFQPEYISSYPGILRNLAIFGLRNHLSWPSVRLLNLTSEMLDTRTRMMIGETFPNAKIVETYTSTEAGFMGFECPDKGGFHLCEDMGIFEIDPGNATSIPGTLIVTDLVNFATPVIRYAGLGDLVSPARKPCGCGCDYFRIEHLEGRIIDSVVLPDGSRLSPFVLTDIVSETPGIIKYQIIQEAPERFCIRVVAAPDGKISYSMLEMTLQSAFRNVLSQDVVCAVQVVEDILPPEGSHKTPLMLSQVDGSCDAG